MLKKIKDTLDNLDIIIKEFGIKYVFVESGRLSVIQHCKEAGENLNDYPTETVWCELSWGSSDGDKYDFAYYSFGNTIGEAINKCLDLFRLDVRGQELEQVNAAKDAGIYQKIMDYEA